MVSNSLWWAWDPDPESPVSSRANARTQNGSQPDCGIFSMTKMSANGLLKQLVEFQQRLAMPRALYLWVNDGAIFFTRCF